MDVELNSFFIISCGQAKSSMVLRKRLFVNRLKISSLVKPLSLTRLGELMAKTLKQTEERVAEVKRRAEEAVSDVKRQAVVELQKAVRAAEEKANEAVASAHGKMEKAVLEARRQATEDTLAMSNHQSDSSEVGI